VIAIALFASLFMQDTNTAVSPRVRAMLDRFPPPVAGVPSITMRYSRDTVWVGEQVELVTVTCFPRLLRDRLRRAPGITPPSLTGLWTARNQQLPVLVGTRVVGGQVYLMYVSWQTSFPLDGGRIEAPPAVLTYDLPTSTSYFAPEDRKTVRSAPAVLVVRPVPSPLAGALGTGPTARNLRLAWRSPVATLHAGSPAIVELAISGDGNLTLWPAPQIAWPPAVHVYPEPTEEHQVAALGLITGEKRFRFTIVTDSAGVLTLPAVQYPYFDPGAVKVEPTAASALSLAILPRSANVAARRPPSVTGDVTVPLATTIVRGWPAAVGAVALLPLMLVLWRRRRSSAAVAPARNVDPESALRAVLGTPVDAGADHVVAALRARGVSRDEAEHIHRWLGAVARWRYGPQKRADVPDPPPMMAQVIARLRRGAAVAILLVAVLPLHAQREGGVARFAGGDYAGAARAFDAVAAMHPLAAGAWRDLGNARWMAADDIGATAAWLRALALAPRDRSLRDAWQGATVIPADVRALGPTVPVSRDELLLASLLFWVAGWLAVAKRWRRVAWATGVACVAALAWAGVRWQAERPGQVLVKAATILRISPHPATTALGEIPAWSRVRIDRVSQNWVLVGGEVGFAGSVGSVSMHGWIPAAAIAPIGPLD
jgi:hypothetical protein